MNVLRLLISRGEIISLTIVIVTLFYYFLGKSTWHYYPIYFLGVLHFILLLLQRFDLWQMNTFTKALTVGLTVFLPVLTYLLLAVFPKTEMPLPTGRFQIGTQTFEFEDASRAEIYSEEVAKRRLKYQVWYPTDEVKGLQKVNWLSDGTLVPRQLLKSASLPAPPFLLDQLALIESNAYANAELSQAEESYPLIIISHGWRGFRELHTDFAEDLASHGYFVLSMDHTYGSEAVKFEDGQIAYLNREALTRMVKPAIFSEKAQQLAMTYGEDVRSMLDELENLNERFDGKLNLEKVGLLGHSTGGAGDVYAALRDDRVKAVIGMDAWVNPLDLGELEEGLSMPALFLRSKQWAWRESKEPLDLLVKNSADAEIIEMDKTKHLDFPMIYMLSPYTSKIGLTGEMGGRESSRLQREIVLDFFDDRLREQVMNADYLEDYIEHHENLYFEREKEWFEELSEKVHQERQKR